MPFGMKRGFLTRAIASAESPARNKDAATGRDGSVDNRSSLSMTNYQFSSACRLYSENPYIVVADYRLPTDSHFLFLPLKNAAIVFIDSLEGVQSIAQWRLWDEACPAPPPNPPFVIQDCGEKGIGMFARRAIARGELIMLERPVFVSHPTLHVHTDQKLAFYEAALAGLAPATQLAIAALHNAQPASPDVGPIRGVLLTNALAATLPHAAVRYPALFPYLCRANHACAPNAHFSFCTATFAGRLHAVRAVAVGEELVIGYTDLMAPRDRRRAELRARYGFACACAVCALPAERAAASDARREGIAEYLARMKEGGKTPPGASLAHVQELIRWAEVEGLVEGASILAVSALRLARRDGDRAAELRLTVDAMNYVRAVEGNGSPGFAALASRVGLSAPQLVAIFDAGPVDYALFERMWTP
ncbi:hypothetical protein DFH09DRAFT_1359061 [Mycena vulgaris]|nr:hypothetical protein DFH09DRAFT_1359061 [Mycena vulgaris]